jgi:hypothetical protein
MSRRRLRWWSLLSPRFSTVGVISEPAGRLLYCHSVARAAPSAPLTTVIQYPSTHRHAGIVYSAQWQRSLGSFQIQLLKGNVADSVRPQSQAPRFRPKILLLTHPKQSPVSRSSPATRVTTISPAIQPLISRKNLLFPERRAHEYVESLGEPRVSGDGRCVAWGFAAGVCRRLRSLLRFRLVFLGMSSLSSEA